MNGIGELYRVIEEGQANGGTTSFLWKQLNPRAFLFVAKGDEQMNYAPLMEYLKDKLDHDTLVKLADESALFKINTTADIPAIVSAIAYCYDNATGTVTEFQDTMVDPKSYFDNAPEHLSTAEKLVDVLAAVSENLDFSRINSKSVYEFKDITRALKQLNPAINLNEGVKSDSFDHFLSSTDAGDMTREFLHSRGLVYSDRVKRKRIYESMEMDCAGAPETSPEEIKALTGSMDEDTVMQLYSEITGKSSIEFSEDMRAVVANHIKQYRDTQAAQAALGAGDDQGQELDKQQVFETYGINESTKKLCSYRVPCIVTKVNESLHRVTLKENGKFKAVAYGKTK